MNQASHSGAGSRSRPRAARWLCALTLSGSLLGFTSGCSEPATESPRASAKRAASRSEMVGGDRALGEVGDVVMQNEKVRLVIQKEGFSRGFGVYGGSLIDADLRRPDESGTAGEAVGNDQFAELFPAFFVQAVNVDQVSILDDGSEGGPARVEASGIAGDFLELAAVLNRAVTGSNTQFRDPDSDPRIRYSTVYELEPDKQYVTTRFQVKNISTVNLTFPGRDARFLFNLLQLPLEGFTVPSGDIALFGATSKVFIPGVGFDLRFGLERAYSRNIDFPAFPGFAAEFVASRGDHASYGLVVDESDLNYAYNKREIYDDGHTPITKSSVLIPFVASSFVGIFYQDAPAALAPGETFEVVKHFVIGSGDVGSVLDVINDLRGEAVGKLGGQVFDTTTGTPSEGVSVIVYQHLPDGYRRVYSQYDVHEDGQFAGTLAPGDYSLKVVGPSRPSSDFVDFEIRSGEKTSLRVASTPPGRIFVHIFENNGDRIPAKATAVGHYGPEHAGQLTPEFLFDLEVGEDFRSTDLIDDDPNDASTRSYIEAVNFTANGQAELLVRPGEYDVTSSRGPEYGLATSKVKVGAGETVTLNHSLRRVVNSDGWVAIDTHIHSRNSIDSGMTLDERVTSIAAEGVEVAVSTDHNYITDYGPYVARNNLNRWLHPIVGVEMTTLESGHFNGYPLDYRIGAITHGSFDWARRTPDQIFSDLRGLGTLGADDTIVQVNHPRDQILGYYSQYNRDPLTAAQQPASFLDSFISPTGPAFVTEDGKTTFSFNYDAVELANGKLYNEIHHYRVPENLPPGNLPPMIPPAGEILRDADGEVAYPGVVDDWFNLLNLGYAFTGVGTGDSHVGFDEAGQFRTMIYVGEDNAERVDDKMVSDAIKSHRAVVTNGPLVDFWVNDPQAGSIGRTISDADGTVQLSYRVQSAPWIGVGRINIYRNGTIALTRILDEDRDLAADPWEETVELPLARDGSGNAIDSWFVVEAMGYRNMHPVIRTLEIPPVVLTDALASLAGPLGLGGDEFGDLKPPEVFPITSYAITNPVWVTTHAGNFNPPGIVPLSELNRPENDPHFQDGIYATSTVSRAARSVELRSRIGRAKIRGRRSAPLFYPLAGDVTDVRKVMGRLGALGRHGAH